MPSPRRSSRLLLALASTLLAWAAAPPARADTLVLQDGRRVQGTLLSVERGWVEFRPSNEDYASADPLRVAVAEVRAIRFDDGRRGGERGGGQVRGAAGGGDGIDPADEADDRPRPSSLGRRAPRADPSRGRMISVPATERWTDTGLDVSAGDVVSFSVAGTVGLGDDRTLGPEGDLDGAAPAPRRPMPDRPAGALIGRIGVSPDDTFFIGGQRLPFRVRTSGRLYLGVNDDTPADDEGAFQVAVSR